MRCQLAKADSFWKSTAVWHHKRSEELCVHTHKSPLLRRILLRGVRQQLKTKDNSITDLKSLLDLHMEQQQVYTSVIQLHYLQKTLWLYTTRHPRTRASASTRGNELLWSLLAKTVSFLSLHHKRRCKHRKVGQAEGNNNMASVLNLATVQLIIKRKAHKENMSNVSHIELFRTNVQLEDWTSTWIHFHECSVFWVKPLIVLNPNQFNKVIRLLLTFIKLIVVNLGNPWSAVLYVPTHFASLALKAFIYLCFSCLLLYLRLADDASDLLHEGKSHGQYCM